MKILKLALVSVCLNSIAVADTNTVNSKGSFSRSGNGYSRQAEDTDNKRAAEEMKLQADRAERAAIASSFFAGVAQGNADREENDEYLHDLKTRRAIEDLNRNVGDR